MTDQHAGAQRVTALLRRTRLRISNEMALQDDILRVLTDAGENVEREVRLSAADRVDFMVDDIAIEAKARYPKRGIYRQLERYAVHDRVGALVLVTGTAMGLPPAIAGKPLYFVSIGRAFL